MMQSIMKNFMIWLLLSYIVAGKPYASLNVSNASLLLFISLIYDRACKESGNLCKIIMSSFEHFHSLP